MTGRAAAPTVPGTGSVDDHLRQLGDFLAGVLPDGWAGYGALEPAERDTFRPRWRAALADSGYLVPGWPRRYGGRDAGLLEQTVVAREFVRAGLPHHPDPNDPISLLLLGPTLLLCGSEHQRERFLPGTVDGSIRWPRATPSPRRVRTCSLCARPGAGTGACGGCPGRRSGRQPGAPRTGCSCSPAPTRTSRRAGACRSCCFRWMRPGWRYAASATRSARRSSPRSSSTTSRCRTTRSSDSRGRGARIALTLLGYERALGGYTNSLGYEVELERLAALVRHHGYGRDALVRDRLARCATAVRAIHCLSRDVLAQVQAGAAPGPESSLIKLLSSEYRQQVTTLALDVLGEELLEPAGADGPYPLGPQPHGLDPLASRAWLRDYLQARPGTVYGGSSQIQRNTIAEQVLGLPRESR